MLACSAHQAFTPGPSLCLPVRKRLTKKGPDSYTEDVDWKELRECPDEVLDTTTPAPDQPPEVWEQHERDGHTPKLPDCPVCVEVHGSVVRRFASTSTSLHTLHLDTGYWGDLSLDGKRYFVVAGLRVQHEDKVLLVPFFIPVENKIGLVVSQEAFQLIDHVASCKQATPGFSRFQGASHFERPGHGTCQPRKHARQRGIHLATSPAHQPLSNGVAEQLVGLAK